MTVSERELNLLTFSHPHEKLSNRWSDETQAAVCLNAKVHLTVKKSFFESTEALQREEVFRSLFRITLPYKIKFHTHLLAIPSVLDTFLHYS